MDKVQEVRFKKDAKEFLFFGAPLLDITELSSQETLDKYELRADDCIRETDKQETLFQRLFSNPDTYKTAGGSSQNTARIAKWILGDRGRVSFAGCVGKDNYAKTMMECLQSEGVEPVYLSLPGESTGVCACLLGIDGNRSMIARLGAAKYFAEHHLQEESVRERLQSSHCIFVEGYFLSHSPDVLQCLANMCYENQIFSISLSAEYICKNYADILARIFPRVDILFSNEAEARVLAQSWHLEDISLVCYFMDVYGIVFHAVLFTVSTLLAIGIVSRITPLLVPWLAASPLVVIVIFIQIFMVIMKQPDLAMPVGSFSLMILIFLIYAAMVVKAYYQKVTMTPTCLRLYNLQDGELPRVVVVPQRFAGPFFSKRRFPDTSDPSADLLQENLSRSMGVSRAEKWPKLRQAYARFMRGNPQESMETEQSTFQLSRF